MKKYIDINTWNRKEHFLFFKTMDDPFFVITADVDFTSVYKKAKESKVSFFLTSLHAIMEAANAIENFRYRLEEDKVVCYEIIHPSSTVGREDGTFGCSFFEYSDDKDRFIEGAKKDIERIKNGQGMMMTEDTARKDVIHYSSVPWIRFTSLKNEACFSIKDSIPKISTGKCTEENGRFIMPVSVSVHHALMDGLHVGQFFEKLEQLLKSK